MSSSLLRLGVWLQLGSVAWPRQALAEEALPISITNTTTSEYRVDNQNGDPTDDEYGVAIERFNVLGTMGGVTASLRIDGSLFLDPPSEGLRNDLRLERISIQYRLADWTLVAGDFFGQLGRGIVLSIRKVDEIGLDLSIRGAKLAYSSTAHSFSAFAGEVNPGNLDIISHQRLDDSRDLLAGASYELALSDALSLGAHGLYLAPEERLLPEEKDRVFSGGVFAALPALAEWIAIYAELDGQHKNLAGEPSFGWAAYLTADLHFGDSIVLLEGLYLDQFEQRGSRNTALRTRFDYNQPPTLERIDQEVFNSRDVLGLHLRYEHQIAELGLLLYASGMYRVNDLSAPNELRQWHAYLGGEHRFDEARSRIGMSAGYRDELQDAGRVKSMIHAEVDYQQAIGDDMGFHLVSVNEFRTLAGDPFFRGSTILGCELSGSGGVSIEVGIDTQDPSREVRKYFVAAIIGWHAASFLEVRAIGGTQRGGIKCIAGVCRDYPEFAGIRAEIIARL